MKKFILSIIIALTFVLPAHAAVYKEISTTDRQEIKTVLKTIVPETGNLKYNYDDLYEINFQGPLQSAIGNFFFYNYHLNQAPDLRVSFILLTGERGKIKVKAAYSLIENPEDGRYIRETYDIANNKPSQNVLYNILETLEAKINSDYTPSYKE